MFLESLHEVIHGFHESGRIYALILELYIVCILFKSAGIRTSALGIGFLQYCGKLQRYCQFRIFRIQFNSLYSVIFEVINELGILFGLSRTLSAEEHVVEKEDDHDRAEQGEDHHP